MADPEAQTTGAPLSDLPMQPTGSGVADLEIAYEQMKLAAGNEGDAAIVGGMGREAGEPDMASVPSASDEAESGAHPS